MRPRRPHRRRPSVTPAGPAIPFPGLAAYSEREAAFFHGRAVEREVLLDNVLAYDVCVLYGPSGAGKSSLVRAGLAAALRGQTMASRPAEPVLADPEHVVAVVFDQWQAAPARALAEQLREALPAEIEHEPWSETTPLSEAIRATARLTGARLVIILDQFEGYFAMPATDIAFDLAELVEDVGADVAFLLVLREDSLALLSRFGDTLPGLFDNLIRLEHLSPESATKALEATIENFNASVGEAEAVQLDPALVEAVVRDVSQVEGTKTFVRSTYLQLVMRGVWIQARRTGTHDLKLQTLQELGTSEQIVAAHVEEVLAALADDEQRLAAQLFRFLITPSGIRMQMSAQDLAGNVGSEPEATSKVIEHLVNDGRLLQPKGESCYQISYDALADPIAAWRDRREARARKRRERWRLLLVFCTVLAVLLAAITIFHDSVEQAELGSVDLRFHIRGSRRPPKNIVIVRIDRRSTEGLGTLRRVLAGDAIDAIVKDDPRVIAFDEDFFGKQPVAETESLLESIAGAEHPIVLAATALSESPRGSRTNILGGEQSETNLAEIHARAGYSAFEPDSDGVIRRPLYSRKGVKSFAVVAAEDYNGQKIPPGAFKGAWIDFYGPAGSLPSVSLWALEHGEVSPNVLLGKIVVAGITDPASEDVHRVPESGPPMTGVELHANAIETVLERFPLKSAPAWLNVLLAVALGTVPLVLYRRLGLPVVIAASVALLAVWAVAVQIAFGSGLVLNVIYPTSALVGVVLLLIVVELSGSTPRMPRLRRRSRPREEAAAGRPTQSASFSR
jgi:CHASE2 domain-containing sensor protein